MAKRVKLKRTWSAAFRSLTPKQRTVFMDKMCDELNLCPKSLMNKRSGLNTMTEAQAVVIEREFHRLGVERVFDDELTDEEKEEKHSVKRPFTKVWHSLLAEERYEFETRVVEETNVQKISITAKMQGFTPIPHYQIKLFREVLQEVTGMERLYDDELTTADLRVLNARWEVARCQYSFQCAYQLMKAERRPLLMRELASRWKVSAKTAANRRLGLSGMTTKQAETVKEVYRELTGNEIIFDRFQSQATKQKYLRISQISAETKPAPFGKAYDGLTAEAKIRVRDYVTANLGECLPTFYAQKKGTTPLGGLQISVVRDAFRREGVTVVFDEDREKENKNITRDSDERLEKYRKMVTRDGLYGYYPMPHGYNHLLGYRESMEITKKKGEGGFEIRGI